MQYYPPLKISPNASPHFFVEHLAELSPEIEGYSIALDDNSDEDTLELNVRADAHPEHLLRVISAKRTDVKHVHVRLSHEDWNTNLPEYEHYTTLAGELMEPLLKAYNRSQKTRLRLQVKSLEDLQPKLTNRIQQAFDDFVQHAHKNLLGGKDWERFYRFIRLTHGFNVRLDEEQVFYLLLQAGFPRQYAREISDVYTHGRALLAG